MLATAKTARRRSMPSPPFSLQTPSANQWPWGLQQEPAMQPPQGPFEEEEGGQAEPLVFPRLCGHG